MGLDVDSSVADLIKRVDFLGTMEAAALERYLEEMTVHDLLSYRSPQALANELEAASRGQYEVDIAESRLARPFPRNVDEYVETVAPLKLPRIGRIAYELLAYAHRMFDPIQSLPDPE